MDFFRAQAYGNFQLESLTRYVYLLKIQDISPFVYQNCRFSLTAHWHLAFIGWGYFCWGYKGSERRDRRKWYTHYHINCKWIITKFKFENPYYIFLATFIMKQIDTEFMEVLAFRYVFCLIWKNSMCIYLHIYLPWFPECGWNPFSKTLARNHSHHFSHIISFCNSVMK